MKKNLTEVAFILDRSGSMDHLTSDTIGGFNTFIDQQKQEAGECYLTTVLFDDRYDLLHDHINITEVKELTTRDYFARGMTALRDAIGKTINTVGARLASTSEEERPEKVIVVITTDGAENSSKEFTSEKIKEMIEHQETKYNWEFIFMGANIDSFGTAGGLGIDLNGVVDYSASSSGTKALYSSIATKVSDVRNNRFLKKSMSEYMSEAENED